MPTSESIPNPLDLTGRRILISGGAGALGSVIVQTLTKYGAHVVINDILSKEGTDSGEYLKADITSEAEVVDMLDKYQTSFGAVPDVVCCHAGLVSSHPIYDFPLTEFDAHMALNVRGAFVLAKAVSKLWINTKARGHIIFTTSWVQDVPWPGIAPYNASKAALKSLTRSFARELAPHQIRANAIAPGIVAAGMAKHQWDTEPDYRQRASKAIPLGYLQPPQSVADAFLFLISPLANYMTGTTLLVDGGASLYPMD